MPIPASTTSPPGSAINSTTHSTSWNATSATRHRFSQQPIQLLELHNVSILRQLQIEEALLRADTGNWILINKGAPPAIVLGISGKEKELINWTKWNERPIPLVRRFSGGGTVVVDPNTFFVTFIMNSDAIATDPHPQPIMQWTEKIYRPLFGPDFQLREHDYCIADRKVGGNAQYIRKGRWLHHTTFLWDYDRQLMSLLTLPERQPAYRGRRPHEAFLTTLQSYFASFDSCVQQVRRHLCGLFQTISPSHSIERYTEGTHRRSTRLLSIAKEQSSS